VKEENLKSYEDHQLLDLYMVFRRNKLLILVFIV